MPDLSTPKEPAPGILGRRRRFTVAEVMVMLEAGVLREDDPFELIEGDLFAMVPQGPEHRSLKDELHLRLSEAYRGRGYHVLNQGPIRAGEDSLPEPDLAVLRGAPRDYLHRHPGGEDVLLVIELAKTSQARDRAKGRVYARAGVPTYWLLDLEERRLWVHQKPSGPATEGQVEGRAPSYGVVSSLAESEQVALPGLEERWEIATMLA